MNEGDCFELTGELEFDIETEVEKPYSLYEGRYILDVPDGQKATIIYSKVVGGQDDD